ncbi:MULTISPECIES: preprotein translocase subunit SecE [Enorma]|uniref:preprotein translocase subunit SecE n=1 Tax=Enorma TaxID=1472762 RepID=UPI000344CE9A|nr:MULTISPECIES: preprotein translocase subunit SecE [Enorma]
MANKKNKKKASQRNAQPSAPAKAQAAAEPKKGVSRKAAKDAESASKSVARAKADMKASKEKAKAKKKKDKKPGFFGRIRNYFRAVRTEMRRVTWPSKKELVNYSLVVIASLVVVGVVIAVLDFVIGEGLFLISGLRS